MLLIFYSIVLLLTKPETSESKFTKSDGKLLAERLINGSNVIIITDMEPDDRIALAVVAARMAGSVLFVGTTVMNAERKAALAKHQFLLFDSMRNVPVFTGTGKAPHNYLDILTSTEAGRTYLQEGAGILTDKELKNFRKFRDSTGETDVHKAFQIAFETAIGNNSQIEILLLAPATDLINSLAQNNHYQQAIARIHVMGGWAEVGTSGEKRSTYNFNMDAYASAEVMKLGNHLPMTLYSSHIIKQVFPGGSVNKSNRENLIDLIFGREGSRSHVPCLVPIQTATMSWNEHVMKTIPNIAKYIKPYKGRQFTPADPLVVIGYLNRDTLTDPVNFSVEIDLEDVRDNGYRMYVTENPNSKIEVVNINPDIFFQEMEFSFQLINNGHSNSGPSGHMH